MMSQEIMRHIKSRLKAMYPGYRFDMTCSQDGEVYKVMAYKENTNLSTYSTKCDMPLNDFWEGIREWMRKILLSGR